MRACLLLGTSTPAIRAMGFLFGWALRTGHSGGLGIFGQVSPGSTQALTSAKQPRGGGNTVGSCELVVVSNYRLALALFVLGDLADDTNDATAMDDLAFVTDLLYGCTDLHSDSLHFPARLEPGSRDTRNDTA